MASIRDLEERITRMEKSHSDLATAFAASAVKVQTLTDAFDAFKVDLETRLDTITVFVSGANTIYGLAKRHWKRIFIFGAGVMTSAGLGNPEVWNFIKAFAGG